MVEALVDRVRALPGVQSVTVARSGILSYDMSASVNVDGYAAGDGEDVVVGVNAAVPGFFRTLGVPLLAGRDFAPHDTEASPRVAIVNEAFARYFLRGRAVVGARFGFGSGPQASREIEIVGMVRDAAFGGLREKSERFVFVCLNQERIEQAALHVRVADSAEGVTTALRREMAALDPTLPLYDVNTLDDRIAEETAGERLLAVLTVAFAAVAAVLVAVGLFGLLTFSVEGRTREIGVRVALGAERGAVIRLVARQTVTLVGSGTLVGLAAAAAVTRYVQSLLWGVRATDPIAYAAAALAIALVAAIAALLPARRATGVDPVVALRCE
jgi:predicted permease